MLKVLMKLTAVTLLIGAAMFTSCTKDNLTSSSEVENYVFGSMEGLHKGGGCGKFGCLEFVYPINITFPDGTTAQIDSLGALRTTIRTWKESNPDATERPTLNFPLSVINADGEIVLVAGQDELAALIAACTRETRGGKGGRGGHGDRACFSLTFPVTINFPDGTTATAADQTALHDLMHAWKAANPGRGNGHPELAFPLTVKMEDGTTTTVADKAALKALKDSCVNSEG